MTSERPGELTAVVQVLASQRNAGSVNTCPATATVFIELLVACINQCSSSSLAAALAFSECIGGPLQDPISPEP